MDSEIPTDGMEDTIIYLLDKSEAYFGSPLKGTFDAILFYWLCNNFLKSMWTLFDMIADGECDLREEKVPKTVQEIMDIVILETQTRNQSIHEIFCDHMGLFHYGVGNRCVKLVTQTSFSHDRLVKKVRQQFFKESKDGVMEKRTQEEWVSMDIFLHMREAGKFNHVKIRENRVVRRKNLERKIRS